MVLLSLTSRTLTPSLLIRISVSYLLPIVRLKLLRDKGLQKCEDAVLQVSTTFGQLKNGHSKSIHLVYSDLRSLKALFNSTAFRCLYMSKRLRVCRCSASCLKDRRPMTSRSNPRTRSQIPGKNSRRWLPKWRARKMTRADMCLTARMSLPSPAIIDGHQLAIKDNQLGIQASLMPSWLHEWRKERGGKNGAS